jgi:hypothetical protein
MRSDGGDLILSTTQRLDFYEPIRGNEHWILVVYDVISGDARWNVYIEQSRVGRAPKAHAPRGEK